MNMQGFYTSYMIAQVLAHVLARTQITLTACLGSSAWVLLHPSPRETHHVHLATGYLHNQLEALSSSQVEGGQQRAITGT